MSLKMWLPLNGNIENQGILNTTSRLPSGYTEVEYLESTGAQYINTGIASTTTMEVQLLFSINSNAKNEDRKIFGQNGTFGLGTISGCWRPVFNGFVSTDIKITEGKILLISNGKTWTFNQSEHYFNGDRTNISAASMFLFSISTSSGETDGGGLDGKIYSAKFIDENIPKRNFIPAVRNSDNKPGMYDTVTNTFYTNAGTGEFSVGPAVICTITNNGAAVDNNGKIGKCYSFNGSDSYISTSDITYFSPDNTWSICFWMYSNSEISAAIIGTGRTTWQWVVGTNGDRIRIHQWNPAGASSIYLDSKSTITINTWYHIGITWDKSVIKLYINGQFDSQMTPLYTTCKTQFTTNIGGNCYYNQGNSFFNGKLNDIRIYDECLSEEQINGISKGLVLHYKMCGNVQVPNNCYSNPTFNTSNANGGWDHWTGSGGSGSFDQNIDKNFIFRSGQTYSHKVVCDSSATWDYLCYQEPEFSGGYRSMCAIIKASDSARITEDICYPNWNSRNGGVEINKWTSVNKLRDEFYLCKCEGIKQDGSNDLVGIYVKPGKTIYISECYLENDYEKCSDFWTRTDIEYDGSGYKNHGTVTGEVTFSTDSPRYTGSYNLAHGKYITAPGFTYIKAGSISFWIKVNTIASSGWLPFSGRGGYIMATAYGTGAFYHDYIGNETKIIYEDGKVVTSPTSNGVWHHYVITGVDLTTWTEFRINNFNSGWDASLQMSDVRIYATILSPEDVQKLYKLGRV